MTRHAAREDRRKYLEQLTIALREIGSGGLTGSGPIEAFATCHQIIGRLRAIDELEDYTEACECGRRAPFPRPTDHAEIMASLAPEQREALDRACLTGRPIIEAIDPDEITDAMIDEAAAHAAANRILAAAESEEEEDALDRLCDELDAELVPYTLPSRIASKS